MGLVAGLELEQALERVPRCGKAGTLRVAFIQQVVARAWVALQALCPLLSSVAKATATRCVCHAGLSVARRRCMLNDVCRKLAGDHPGAQPRVPLLPAACHIQRQLCPQSSARCTLQLRTGTALD